jgi:hypothetical protein
MTTLRSRLSASPWLRCTTLGYPFAVAFTLAGGKGDVMAVPPGGARGNLKGYLT